MLQISFEDSSEYAYVVYVDEAGRGCLAGPVFAGAVIWPTKLSDVDKTWSEIKDSKKISRKKRSILVPYIEDTARAFHVGTASVDEIDKYNILQATYLAMHRAIEGALQQMEVTLKTSIDPSSLLLCIDGNNFKPFLLQDQFVSHVCVPKGDNRYMGIAAASILAKVYHDRYILQLCANNTDLHNKYGWEKNVCYGTKQHRDGIDKHGITKHHRKSFGICQKFNKSFVKI